MTPRRRIVSSANRRVLALADAVVAFGLPQDVREKIARSEGTAEERLAATDPGTRQQVALGLGFGWCVVAGALVVLDIAADQVIGRLISRSLAHAIALAVLIPVVLAAGAGVIFAVRLLRVSKGSWRRWLD